MCAQNGCATLPNTWVTPGWHLHVGSARIFLEVYGSVRKLREQLEGAELRLVGLKTTIFHFHSFLQFQAGPAFFTQQVFSWFFLAWKVYQIYFTSKRFRAYRTAIGLCGTMPWLCTYIYNTPQKTNNFTVITFLFNSKGLSTVKWGGIPKQCYLACLI